MDKGMSLQPFIVCRFHFARSQYLHAPVCLNGMWMRNRVGHWHLHRHTPILSHPFVSLHCRGRLLQKILYVYSIYYGLAPAQILIADKIEISSSSSFFFNFIH